MDVRVKIPTMAIMMTNDEATSHRPESPASPCSLMWPETLKT